MSAEFRLYEKSRQSYWFCMLEHKIAERLHSFGIIMTIFDESAKQVQIHMTDIPYENFDIKNEVRINDHVYQKVCLKPELGADVEPIYTNFKKFDELPDDGLFSLGIAIETIVEALIIERSSDGLTPKDYKLLKDYFLDWD